MRPAVLTRRFCGPSLTLSRILTVCVVSDEVAVRVSYGQVLERNVLMVAEQDEGPWAVVNPAGELLAVYGSSRGRAKPMVVISEVASPRTP